VQTYVYIAVSGAFSKIGHSRQPNIRLHQLRYKPAVLSHVIRTLLPYDVEQLALTYLRDYRVSGEEYLSCSTRLSVAAVKLSASALGAGYELIFDREPDRWLEPVYKSLAP